MQETAVGASKKPKKPLSHRRVILRRLYKNPQVIVGGSIILMFILVAVFASFIAPFDPYEQVMGRRLQEPCSEHIMGTDWLGRDLFSRLIYGTRVSISISLSATAIGAAAGILIGLMSGYYGKALDTIIMGIINIMMALPAIILALTLITILGTSTRNIIIAIAIFAIPTFARVTRGSVLGVKKLEYVDAARALGASDARIIFKHILPNISAPLIIQSTIYVASAVLIIAALSFLGMGVQPPTPEWGGILDGGREFFARASHIMIFPGLFILFLVVSINLLGDGLRDALEPKQTK
ncbi:MAG: ABC transporter permease [Oscillospiraceae bacterium]|nr:ABC transporter permease [Oscillospiraceae bacterium]